MGLGVIGAALLALLAGRISEAFDGIGQDLVTIGILATALAMLLWHCLWVSTHSQQMVREARQLGSSVHGAAPAWALIGAVALAVLREGAETVLFVAGSATDEGGALAPACWVPAPSACWRAWPGLAGLCRAEPHPVRHLFTATNALIALLAASIASQLMRAPGPGRLAAALGGPALGHLHLLSPDSAVGTLAHALVGYDAQPSGAQFMAYVAVITLIVVGTRLQQAKTR